MVVEREGDSKFISYDSHSVLIHFGPTKNSILTQSGCRCSLSSLATMNHKKSIIRCYQSDKEATTNPLCAIDDLRCQVKRAYHIDIDISG